MTPLFLFLCSGSFQGILFVIFSYLTFAITFPLSFVSTVGMFDCVTSLLIVQLEKQRTSLIEDYRKKSFLGGGIKRLDLKTSSQVSDWYEVIKIDVVCERLMLFFTLYYSTPWATLVCFSRLWRIFWFISHIDECFFLEEATTKTPEQII